MSMNHSEERSKIMESNSTKEKVENQIWRELPSELLSSVIANLEIKDNVRASLVCKSWYEAAVSVRVIDQPPWLINFHKSNISYEFYNPSNLKKYTMELPKSLLAFFVSYSRDGWLLMSHVFSPDFVLFNPFTLDVVVLPTLGWWYGYQVVGFSSAPTSSNCVVVAIIKDFDPGHVTIWTWSPGETTWSSMQVGSQFRRVENVVFSSGLFYCLNISNRLAVFDPCLRTWNVLDVVPPRYPEYVDDESRNEGKFMVGYKGDIFLVCTHGNEDPWVFKLDLLLGVWEKKENLGSLTIFASAKSCESRTYVPERMLRNSIYFPKICDNEERCVTYSFDEGTYSPCAENLGWGKLNSFEKMIWIEASDNALELIQKHMGNV